MPKQLALLLCSLFVLWLLKYDRRRSNKVSLVLWLPSLWTLCIATRSIDSWLGVTGGSRESGGVLDPIFQSCLLCLGLIILAKRGLNWSSVARENIWLTMLIGFMLVSVVWSDIPFISFKRWIREFTAVTMALLVVTEPAPLQAMQSLLRRTIYILIPFSILLVKYFQDLGVIYNRWTGDIQVGGSNHAKKRPWPIVFNFSIFSYLDLHQKMEENRRCCWQTPDQDRGNSFDHDALASQGGRRMWAASATAIYSLSLGLITFFALSWIRKHRIQLGVSTWVAIVACIIGLGIITPFVGGSLLLALHRQ